MMNWKVKKLQGLEIKGYPEDDIFASIGKDGKFFEEDILRAWQPYFEHSKVIFDIGANLGNHSLYWASHTKAEQIVAFEPCLVNYELLSNNARRNGLGQIIPWKLAVGARNTFVRQKASLDFSHLGNTAYEYCTEQECKEEQFTRVVTIDAFVQEENLKTIDFVKIDTEGFGFEVLKGMNSITAFCKPGIWIEMEPSDVDMIYDFCVERGYVLVDVRQMNALFIHPQSHPGVVAMAMPQLLARLLIETENAVDYERKYYEEKKRHESYHK